MKSFAVTVCAAALLHLAPGAALAVSGPPSHNVAWLAAAADADIDRA